MLLLLVVVLLMMMMMLLMLPNEQPSAAVTASSAAPTGDGERCTLLHSDLHHRFPARKRHGAPPSPPSSLLLPLPMSLLYTPRSGGSGAGAA